MRRFAIVISISLSLTACAGLVGGDDGSNAVGSAEAHITQVPPMVACISITAVGGGRSVTDNFSVTPGQSSVLKLSNLPVGNDSFSADAYAVACNALAGAQPNWSSSAVVAPVGAGQVTNLALTLEPSGGANVGINFDTDGGVDGGSDGGSDGGVDGGPGDGGVDAGDGGGGIVDGGPVDLSRPADLVVFPHD